MSVIPFIIDGKKATVVVDQQAFSNRGGVDGDAVLIQNLDRAQLESTSKDSNATYDLCVGPEYQDHRDDRKIELLENEEITLRPGAAVIILTEEYLHLPKSMFGSIVPKVSLLKKGISNTSSKVDPGYPGQLLVTVFNLGKRTVKLGRKKPFCSLCLHEVRDGARPYAKGSQRIPSAPGKVPHGKKIRDWMERNPQTLFGVSIVVSIIAIIVSFVVAIIK